LGLGSREFSFEHTLCVDALPKGKYLRQTYIRISFLGFLYERLRIVPGEI